MNEKKRWHRIGELLALLSVVSLAVQPLMSGPLPWRGDGYLHFFRLAQLARAVPAAGWLPRWSPDLGFGYGFPLFNYYAPLSYYIPLPTHWLGLSLANGMRLGYFLALLLLAAALFYWAKLVAERASLPPYVVAVVAAATGLYTPYILINVYQRAAYAELWGLALLALTLAAVAYCDEPLGRWQWMGVAGGVAALMLTHNITAMIGIPIVVAYGGLRWWETGRSPQFALKLSSPLLFGLLLSAFFWVPAFFEKELVQIERLYASSNFDYHNHFLAWRTLLPLPATADPFRVNQPFPPGLAVWAGLLTIVGLWTVWQTRQKAAGRELALLTLLFVGLLAMTLPLSEFVWDAVSLLRFVQFPWRLLGPATLVMAPIAGIGAGQLVAKWRRSAPVAGALSLMVAMVWALPWLFPVQAPVPTNPTPLEILQFEQRTGALGTTSAGDYLPRTVAQLPASDSLWERYAAANGVPIARLDESRLPAGFTLQSSNHALVESNITYHADAATQLEFDWFYFQGWRATVDDTPVELSATEGVGRIGVAVPAGEHHLRLWYGGTPLQNGMGWLSIFSALVVIVGIVWPRLWPMPISSHPISTGNAVAVGPLLLIGLLFVVAKVSWLDHNQTWFRASPYAETTLQDESAIAPVNFGAVLSLLGYRLPTEPIPADQPIELTLFWRALPPVTEEYSVGVHLIDAEGQRYGQSDNLHPAGIPTTRWQASEYAHDQHQINVLAGLPPGPYTARLVVYAAHTGQQLERTGADGRPAGIDYELGTIQIAPPAERGAFATISVDEAANHAFGDGVELFGWANFASTVTVGEPLFLTLFWQATSPPTQDYSLEMRLLNPQQELVASQRDSLLLNYPTSQWVVGQPWRDLRLLLIPPEWQGEGNRPVESGTYQLELKLIQSDGMPLGDSLLLGNITIESPEHIFAEPAPSNRTAAQFEEVATLIGYDIVAPSNDAPLTVTLYWQGNGTTPVGYTVFVQLLDADNRIIAQSDSPPQQGMRPTTGWVAGEYIADMHHLAVSALQFNDAISIVVGFYDPATGDRLFLGDGKDNFQISLR